MNMNEETKKLNELSNKYEKAKAIYLAEARRDMERKDGSSRQDALHDRFMQESKDEYNSAKVAFENQVKHVAKLLSDKNT
ncbi:hypothetical protein [Psychrobacter aquimaris]|uniref:hypothetical protein n=1 Tax=Psychrobacter aquimaris TaxID=292733 RepID=UPI003FD32C20